MTGYQLFGAGMLASVFVAMAAVMVVEAGWRAAAAVWGATLAVTAVIVVGVGLAVGQLP